jgi:hypothetical protein
MPPAEIRLTVEGHAGPFLAVALASDEPGEARAARDVLHTLARAWPDRAVALLDLAARWLHPDRAEAVLGEAVEWLSLDRLGGVRPADLFNAHFRGGLTYRLQQLLLERVWSRLSGHREKLDALLAGAADEPRLAWLRGRWAALLRAARPDGS